MNKKYMSSTMLILLLANLTSCGPTTICIPEKKMPTGRKYPKGRCEASADGTCPEGFIKTIAETPLKAGKKCSYTEMVPL